MPQFRFGLVGLGGYAELLCDVLESTRQLTAVCEPDQATHGTKIDQLKSRGVAYFSEYDKLLKSEIDGVCLPLPIDLHRPYTERACAAGKAALCEKPAAGTVDDLDAMIAARDRAGVPVAIGFQHIYDPATIERKRQMLRGQRPTAATVLACWPRDSAYYSRNSWAGKLRRNNAWVLDGPANNAMAHYINLALFLLGPYERTSATPVSIEAELYRANRIENYDTCAMRVGTDTDAELLVLLTHACRETINPEITFHPAGPGVSSQLNEAGLRAAMFTKFVNWARGRDEIVATLEMARTHLAVCNGASQCTAVLEVPTEFREVVQRDNATLTTIMGIESVFRSCAKKRMLPSEMNVAWALPGGSIDVSHYKHFTLFAARGVADQEA